MRIITIYKNKKTGEEIKERELFDQTRQNFNTYEEWETWVNENYTSRERWVESPYERTRRAVYSTGNKWSIENFNATHN